MRQLVVSTLKDQFRRPRGPLGVVAGRIMGRRSSNGERTRETVRRLELGPAARVLEIGYGPGVGIVAAAQAAPNGIVVGIDHSSTMRSMALRAAQRAGVAERVDLRIGDIADGLPPGLGPFDAAFCCNVWQFWPDQQAVVDELAGELAPDGRLAITLLPRHDGATRADALRAGETIAAQLTDAGLQGVRVEVIEFDPVPAVCVVGHRAT
jgi:SAM-dependent methyltransferase